MSGASIAAEIKAALIEVGEEIGAGEQIGTLVRPGVNIGEPDEPVFGPDDEFNFTVLVTKFSDRERKDTAILKTDTKIICSIGETVPAVPDVMRVLGVDYKIYGVDPSRPAGVDLVYRIWARS